jgi:nucleotide-binding universal stress UspA family protein
VTDPPVPQVPAPRVPVSPGPAGTPTVIVWVTEGTWRGCVDAARALAPAGAAIVLLHVSPEEVPGTAHGAYAGLLGRGHPERDPGPRLAELAAAAGRELLAAAAGRLARPSTQIERRGRVEREVVAAADGAGLLILARDGDLRRLGPKSLGRADRFVVDHAPCPVLLVWPEGAPGVGTIPPPPPHPPRHGPRR